MNETQIIILAVLSFFDTIMTYEWSKACLQWKPGLKFKQVEANPFVCLCWNNFGMKGGSIVSGFVLFGVQYLLSSIHINIYYIVVLILSFAIINHLRNFYVLGGRIKSEIRELEVKKK